MNRRVFGKRRKSVLLDDFETPINPMDGLANLADAMLVLAVGIMLALVINWNVDLAKGTAAQGNTWTPDDSTVKVDGNEAGKLDDDQLPDGETSKTYTQTTAYYDPESNTYYIVPVE